MPRHNLRNGYFTIRHTGSMIVYHESDERQAVWEVNNMAEAVQWSKENPRDLAAVKEFLTAAEKIGQLKEARALLSRETLIGLSCSGRLNLA